MDHPRQNQFKMKTAENEVTNELPGL